MIGTILDEAQKLFGKGFLIAAFVPGLLFVTAVMYLWWDFAALNQAVQAWSEKGLKESAFEALLALGAVYLVAYVIYGVRVGVHQLYQGQWPTPLKWLRPVGLALARRSMTEHRAALHNAEIAVDDPRWAVLYDFKATYVAKKLALNDARARLAKTHASHESILQCLKKGDEVQPKAYLNLLHEARLLQANQDEFPADLQNEVDRLVHAIKAAYEGHPPIRGVAANLNAVALREWAVAYADLVDNFPDDERWLQPTQLGNIATVLELHPLRRYGIVLSSLWPRLLHVIPEDARLRIEEANIYLDFTALMSLLSLTTTMIAIFADFYGPPRSAVVRTLLPIIFLLSFWLFYGLAIQATRAFGTQIQATVDLYRFKLLDALDIKRPGIPAEEKAIWTELNNFIAKAEVPQKHVCFKV